MEKRSGTWSPFVVEVLNNNRATVLFTSDESGTDRGFLAKVEEIRLTTTKDPIYGNRLGLKPHPLEIISTKF